MAKTELKQSSPTHPLPLQIISERQAHDGVGKFRNKFASTWADAASLLVATEQGMVAREAAGGEVDCKNRH